MTSQGVLGWYLFVQISEGRKQKQTSLWSSFPVHCASVFGPVMYCLHPQNRTCSSASVWGKRSPTNFQGRLPSFFSGRVIRSFGGRSFSEVIIFQLKGRRFKMRLIASLFCFGNFQISISWQQECNLFIAVQRNSGPKPSDFQSWALLDDFCQGSLNGLYFIFGGSINANISAMFGLVM